MTATVNPAPKRMETTWNIERSCQYSLRYDCLFVKTATQIACLALIAFVFGAGVYRAATESITADEAFTYNRFVAAPTITSSTPTCARSR
jgi:hypothetical protein